MKTRKLITLLFSLFLAMVSMSETVQGEDVASVMYCESIPQEMDLATTLRTADAWADLITGAQETLDIGQYYWTLSDGADYPGYGGEEGVRILELLKAALARGVRVRIVQNALSSVSSGADTRLLASLGAAVATVDFAALGLSGIFHTKLLVADGARFYVGSANSDWRSLTQVKETGVVVRGAPVLASDAQRVFDAVWLAATARALPAAWPPALAALTSLQRPAPLPGAPDNATAYLAVSPPAFCTAGRTDAVESTLAVLARARRSVAIELMDYMPAVVYGPAPRYWGVVDDALRAAAFRGVRVRLLLGLWPHTSPRVRPYLASLDALPNIDVRWLAVPPLAGRPAAPYSRVSHSKFLVADDTAYVTTSNWYADYFLDTHGVTLVADSPDLAASLLYTFDRDWNSPYVHNLSYADSIIPHNSSSSSSSCSLSPSFSFLHFLLLPILLSLVFSFFFF